MYIQALGSAVENRERVLAAAETMADHDALSQSQVQKLLGHERAEELFRLASTHPAYIQAGLAAAGRSEQ